METLRHKKHKSRQRMKETSVNGLEQTQEQGHGKSTAEAAQSDAVLQELLAGKIAELQIGPNGDLDKPVDLTGIYKDAKLPEEMLSSGRRILDDESMSDADKLSSLDQQLHQSSDTVKKLQQKIEELDARSVLLKRRQNSMGKELSKAIATKNKLEKLCRELQAHNKSILAESRRIADEEDQKRKQLSSQFQTTMDDVSTKMDKQAKDYIASLQENESLQGKLKNLLEQVQTREEHFEKQLKAKDLEKQIAEEKLKHQEQVTAQKSDQVDATMDKVKEFAEREEKLQAQLNAYAEKFSGVEETLTKSNDMFTTFRDELAKMSKYSKKLEKENAALKKKCAEYDNGAIASIQTKVSGDSEKQKLQERVKVLEGLCRRLQAERTEANTSTA